MKAEHPDTVKMEKAAKKSLNLLPIDQKVNLHGDNYSTHPMEEWTLTAPETVRNDYYEISTMTPTPFQNKEVLMDFQQARMVLSQLF